MTPIRRPSRSRPSSARAAAWTTSVAIAMFLLASMVLADDWPGFRGATADGAARDVSDLFEGEAVGLELGWRFKVGRAYSALAISNGTVIALGSDGTNDLVIALDGVRGEERWRTVLGPMTKGHDGSDDGPLSTPAIAQGRVFVMGADGSLSAFSLDSGDALWRVAPAENGTVPAYFHSTSPLVFGDQVIVSVGKSEVGTLRSHKVSDGTVLWQAAPGQADYQSPVAMTLAGKEQILFWLDEKVVSLDRSGKELWSMPAPGNGQQAPVRVSGESILLGGDDSTSVFDIALGPDGAWSQTERWTSRKLKPDMSSPVVYDGHVYGFDRAFLSALDVATGEVKWKSRPPGGTGLVLVGDRLAIFAKDGEVVIAKASPEGYQEEARLQATRNESLTWPAFADGTIFVRDSVDVAAIRVTDKPMKLEAPEPALIPDTRFTEWVNRARTSGRAKVWVEELIRSSESFPIREGEFIHFVYHGEAENVGLTASFLDQNDELELERLEGTNLHVRSVQLDPSLRVEYGYRVDFDNVEVDPLNPVFVPGMYGGTRSVLDGVGSVRPSYLAPFEGAQPGRIETFTLASAARGDEREIQVYLPGVSATGGTGRGASASNKPGLIIVPRGRGWLGSGQLVNTLDHLISSGELPPMVVAFVPAAARMAYTEDDGADTPALAKLLAEELVPLLRRRFGATSEAKRTVLLTNHYHNGVGEYAALAYPEVIGGAVLLSSLGSSQWSAQLAELAKSPKAHRSRFYLSWNQIDSSSSGVDAKTETMAVAERLRSGGVEVMGGERVDTAGWGSLRIAAVEGLLALFSE